MWALGQNMCLSWSTNEQSNTQIAKTIHDTTLSSRLAKLVAQINQMLKIRDTSKKVWQVWAGRIMKNPWNEPKFMSFIFEIRNKVLLYLLYYQNTFYLLSILHFTRSTFLKRLPIIWVYLHQSLTQEVVVHQSQGCHIDLFLKTADLINLSNICMFLPLQYWDATHFLYYQLLHLLSKSSVTHDDEKKNHCIK